jgi:CheY-like chemotaxis protein
VLSDYLHSRHYHVIVARSGYEALDLALVARPDIILMDIQMPGIDGLETIRRIRAHPDPQFARTPTLAITALALPGDGERCLAAGADGYLSKPLRLSELAALMRVTLGS